MTADRCGGFRVHGVVAALLAGLMAVLAPSAKAQANTPAATRPANTPAQADAGMQAGMQTDMQTDSSRYIVLAVDNPIQAVPRRAGSSLSPYAAAPRYGVGAQAAGVLEALQREHGLTAVAAWPIQSLGVQCVVFAVPEGTPRDALLQRLASDARVRLAQPLQYFHPLTSSPVEPAAARYNDPYVNLQRGFADLAAARAHRISTGRDVAVAVVDTGVDTSHPDLAGRVAEVRDLAGSGTPFDADRHGTEVAGVIAATGNNGLGIVGIAPQARLWLYRACWYATDGRARCNSFTLAKALAAVLDGPARVLNLSLGGPADPLLAALLQKAQQQRRIVVAALPASGRREGFPAGLPGVLVAGTAGTALPPGVLPAPGRDVLTLTPGARFDYASGSSLAAAHASGVAALLLAAEPGLDAPRLQLLMSGEAGTADDAGSAVLNAERALLRLEQGLRQARLPLPR